MSGTVPTPWTWNFPPCPQWVPESDGQRIRQARKVAEEVVEALHAVDQWGDENVSGYVWSCWTWCMPARRRCASSPRTCLTRPSARWS